MYVRIEGGFMREEILSILKNSDKALTVYDIQDKLGVNTVEGT